MEQYNGDEMENVIPSEQLEIWDICHILVEDKEPIIKKKGQGSAIMASDFLCTCYGPLCLIEANAIWLGLDREARVIIKLEQQADVLVCSRMTLYQKVENKFKDGWYIRDYEKNTQPMFFIDENNCTIKFKEDQK
ncbi:229_t:CDS:2, partial [Gigaspora rosea]